MVTIPPYATWTEIDIRITPLEELEKYSGRRVLVKATGGKITSGIWSYKKLEHAHLKEEGKDRKIELGAIELLALADFSELP